jgi:hypothetical protein
VEGLDEGESFLVQEYRNHNGRVFRLIGWRAMTTFQLMHFLLDSVLSDKSLPGELDLVCTPNPFNSQFTVRISTTAQPGLPCSMLKEEP